MLKRDLLLVVAGADFGSGLLAAIDGFWIKAVAGFGCSVLLVWWVWRGNKLIVR